ncbi:MAG: hypothetical protein U5K77_04465 [Candidatus Saccharibacteria bacterium]|nr:hypothetical protein [Candidatus Saccharibacteria bacterium]
MIVIGMTGPIGHGKSTFASAIKELEPTTIHLESSLIIAEIANAMHATLTDIPDPYDVNSLNQWLRSLPAILLDVMNVKCDMSQIRLDPADIEQHPAEYQKLILHVENLQREPHLAKQEITKDNKEAYRPMLQWLGGYLVEKVKPTIWYDEVVRRVQKARESGCKLVIVGGLRYPSDATALRKIGGIIIKVYRPGHLQNDMLDPTERERDNIRVDSTVMSNGSIEDVPRCAKLIIKDIKADNLQTLYQTVDARK